VKVTLSADVPVLDADRLEAVAGAAAEALTNAAKHGKASRVVVFADLDEDRGALFLSVKDDGEGFDPETVAEGVGIARSIRDRVERVGGAVTFASAPGEGTEIRITVPA